MTVCKNFKLTKKLGTGAFGEIYLAVNKNNEEEMYAAKLEDATAKNPQLFFEAKLYKYLNTEGNQRGIPRVRTYSDSGARRDHRGAVQHHAHGSAGQKPRGSLRGC